MNLTAAKQYIIQRLDKELSPQLYYHGLHHTLDVEDAVNKLAAKENLLDEELLLLQTAALFHDSGFIEQYKYNEPIGVKIAREALPQFNYSPNQIDTISSIIMATARQRPPKNLSEKIMCDADLDYLGRTDYEIIANTLRKELSAFGSDFTDIEWLQLQINFLKQHVYYTNSAIQKNNGTKMQHLAELQKKININSA